MTMTMVCMNGSGRRILSGAGAHQAWLRPNIRISWHFQALPRGIWEGPAPAAMPLLRSEAAIGLGDAEKIRGLQAGATDQGAVDVGDAEQLPRVRRLHRTAVENAHALGMVSKQTGKRSADMRMRLRHVGRTRRESRADRPNRLVGNDRVGAGGDRGYGADRKSTRLNSSHVKISYAVFCLKKKKKK